MNLAHIKEATKALIMWINIKKLEPPLPIILAEIVNVNYRESILLLLEDCSCFIPKQVTNTFRSKTDMCSPVKYTLVFKVWLLKWVEVYC